MRSSLLAENVTMLVCLRCHAHAVTVLSTIIRNIKSKCTKENVDLTNNVLKRSH